MNDRTRASSVRERVRLRGMRHHDLNAVMAIERESHTQPWTLRMLREELTRR